MYQPVKQQLALAKAYTERLFLVLEEPGRHCGAKAEEALRLVDQLRVTLTNVGHVAKKEHAA